MINLNTENNKHDTDIDKLDGTGPDLEQARHYELIPVDWYLVEITGAEVKETRNKQGMMLVAEFTIICDKYAGRKVWSNFNILNSSEKAQEIGQRELGRMLKALGYDEKERFSNENNLLGQMLEIRIEIEKGDGNYDDKNVAKKFRRLCEGSNAATHPKQASQQYQQQSPEPVSASELLPESEFDALIWQVQGFMRSVMEHHLETAPCPNMY